MRYKFIPCFVAPINRVPTAQPDIPCKQVQCHCPQACWVALSTLAAVAAQGSKPTYYCPTCCPDEVRGAIQAIADDMRDRIAKGDPTVDPGQPVSGLIYGAGPYNDKE